MSKRKTAIAPLNAGKIALSRLDFLELEARHSSARAEIIEGSERIAKLQEQLQEQFKKAQEEVAARVKAADEHRKALLTELAVKYRFDPDKLYKSCLKRSMLIQVDAQGNEL